MNNNNGKMPKLDIQYNTDYHVKILGHKSGESDFGPWYLYQLEYQGKKYNHFAQPNLHVELQEYGVGDMITIRKQQTEKDGYQWIVDGEATTKSPISSANLMPADDRTHDIHRQVCLKAAIQSYPSTDRPWNEDVVGELRRRMELLLTVLESNRDDLPF